MRYTVALFVGLNRPCHLGAQLWGPVVVFCYQLSEQTFLGDYDMSLSHASIALFRISCATVHITSENFNFVPELDSLLILVSQEKSICGHYYINKFGENFFPMTLGFSIKGHFTQNI